MAAKSAPSHLYAAKLKALARTHSGTEVEVVESPGASGGLSASDGLGYLLAEGEDALASFGPGLVWALKHDLTQLIFFSDEAAGGLARRAGLLDLSELKIDCFSVNGTTIEHADATPLPVVPELTPEVWALAGLINESGARAVDDHGRLVAELAGLEIARVGRDLETDAGPVLEVGVGQADRELHQLVHSNLEPDAALRRAAAMVATHRRPGAPPHPLNRLARERWIRSLLLEDPSIVGAAALDPVPPLWPRSTLLGTQAIAAMGPAIGGGSVVAVSSVGVDLGLVPEAAEYRLRHDPTAELVIVIPARDRYPITEQLVASLERTRLVTIRPPWEADPADAAN